MIGQAMNRAQRRKAERQQRHADAAIPEWKKAEIASRAAFNARLAQNGITQQDLDDAYARGRRDAQEAYVNKTLPYQQKFFYSACVIAAHDLFGFGKQRGQRLLDETERIMTEEITTDDIIARCKRETGIDIMAGNYTI